MTAPATPVKRVLVIDDETHIREIVQTCLEILGRWKVQVAASGQEGLSKAMLEPPDAIVLDVMMPQMNGLSVLKQLRANSATQSIPVVLLTARVDLIELPMIAKLKVAGVIAKPFNPVGLANQLSKMLDWDEEYLTEI
jgi:CheY-like chemotaxis protein